MIYFKNVTKSFGSQKVLNRLNLHIARGKITFIVGKSGEGKSVTIKHMLGLLHPDEGQIIVDGHDITKFNEEEMRVQRRQFGMLFQHAALFDSLTVLENVLFPLVEQTSMNAQLAKRRADEVLKQVGLAQVENKYPEALSTGEKKRVGLARALAAKPKILLYDEPTTGMDPLVSEMIDQLLVKVNHEEKDMTSVVISHDLKAALATADHIIMLYKGQVIEEGSSEAFRKSTNAIVRQFFSGKVNGPMELV